MDLVVTDLDTERCSGCLRSESIWPVGISVGALSAILPVFFRVAGEKIVFRTLHGTKLTAALSETVVAFEVDHVSPGRGPG